MRKREQTEQIEWLAAAVSNRVPVSRLDVYALVNSILKDAGIEPTLELRRDYDGVSVADSLVLKMIGEYLINGRINV